MKILDLLQNGISKSCLLWKTEIEKSEFSFNFFFKEENKEMNKEKNKELYSIGSCDKFGVQLRQIWCSVVTDLGSVATNLG